MTTVFDARRAGAADLWRDAGGATERFEPSRIALLIITLMAVLTFGTAAEAQVIGWGDDPQAAAEQHPTRAATREAALGPGARVVEVIYFDADNDGLDDELVTLRAAPTDGSIDRQADNFCEDVPNLSTDCNRTLIFLKRSRDGWTPFVVFGGFVQTTYAWVGGVHVGRGNMLVVDMRSGMDDPTGSGRDTGPPLAHSYVLISWRAGALHLLNEGVSWPRGERLYLAATDDGLNFRDARGCSVGTHLRGESVVVDPPPRCVGGRRRGRR